MSLNVFNAQLTKARLNVIPTKKILSAMGEFHCQTTSIRPS